MASASSCCPEGSAPFMAPNYNVMGSCKILEGSGADGLEGYVSKAYVSGQKALVLIPDAFGWNSGRLRNVADYFAAEGIKIHTPRYWNPTATNLNLRLSHRHLLLSSPVHCRILHGGSQDHDTMCRR